MKMSSADSVKRKTNRGMTLADLITKVELFGKQFSSCQIPLVDEQYVEITNIQFEAEQDTDGSWFIQMTVK